MKTHAAAFGAALLLLALPAVATAQEPQTATLIANGDGAVMVTPDIASVTLGVVTRARTAGAALSENSIDLANAIAAIRAENVAEKDIGTSNFSIHPVYEDTLRDTQSSEPPKIVGYEVNNTINVTIRDIASSGGILDKVVTAGANRVSGISFDVADRTGAEDAALKAAIADARRKAELMAAAAGVKLVRILSVSAGGPSQPVPVFARAAAAAPVPVMPGQQSVTVSATVTYEIAPR